MSKLVKIKNNKSLQILIFLGLYGFAIGLFSNYRELWLSSNNLSPLSISRVISIAKVITVLILFFFTIKVSTNKLKDGISLSLILKMFTSTILLCLNNTNRLFLIKFFMFFDIAIAELILASIYPFIMTIEKNDMIYTKKDVIESLCSKFGFLIVSILIGKTIFNHLFSYNSCLFLSIIFTFISFLVLISVNIEKSRNNNNFDIKECLVYFKNNKVFILYLITTFICSIAWSSAIGMPLLTLTKKLNFNPNFASIILLIFGILSNVLSLIIVKYFKLKNDYINLFFKYGLRLVLYFLVFISNNYIMFIIMFIWLLITDIPYGFILNGYYINKINEKYSLLFVTLKYCVSLLGDGLGIFFCGLVFSSNLKFLVLPSLIIGLIHYFLAVLLVNKKRKMESIVN